MVDQDLVYLLQILKLLLSKLKPQNHPRKMSRNQQVKVVFNSNNKTKKRLRDRKKTVKGEKLRKNTEKS
jgi:hypothetical protein